MVFTCECFNQYIHGREYTVIQTDHRLLIPIFTMLPKDCNGCSWGYRNTASKWCTILAHCRHAKSHLPEGDNIFNLNQEAKLHKEIQDIDPAEQVRVSKWGLAKIRAATQQDPMLQLVATTVHQGWLESKMDVPMEIRAFWLFRDELTEHDKIIYKGTKIIIPKSMQPLMKQRIHLSHQGAYPCVQQAKDVLFWPGMASEIRHLVSQCSICNDYVCCQTAKNSH